MHFASDSSGFHYLDKRVVATKLSIIKSKVQMDIEENGRVAIRALSHYSLKRQDVVRLGH